MSALLAALPMMGRSRPDLAPGLRRHLTPEGYAIYYTPTADGIEVQRVCHGARPVDPSMFNL